MQLLLGLCILCAIAGMSRCQIGQPGVAGTALEPNIHAAVQDYFDDLDKKYFTASEATTTINFAKYLETITGFGTNATMRHIYFEFINEVQIEVTQIYQNVPAAFIDVPASGPEIANYVNNFFFVVFATCPLFPIFSYEHL